MISPQSTTSRPESLILARAEALRSCDYGAVWDSYHPESNFRRQFPDREEYVRYGWNHLGKDFKVRACTIVRVAEEPGEARVIFLMDFALHGERQLYAELAWLERGGEGWLYRCGQKLSADDWPVPGPQLDFTHFEAVTEKILY